MLKQFLRLSLFLTSTLILLGINTQAQILNLTDENTMGLTLDRLKKAIQKTDTLQAFAIIGDPILIKDEMIDPRDQVRSIFEEAGDRETLIPPPPGAEDRKFWDLEFVDLNVEFTEDSTEAIVSCRLKLWGAKTDVPRMVKQAPESFKFKRNGSGWKLAGFDSLLEFLWEEVNNGEKD